VYVQKANQTSQYGITWKFDRDYQVGQFDNVEDWMRKDDL